MLCLLLMAWDAHAILCYVLCVYMKCEEKTDKEEGGWGAR